MRTRRNSEGYLMIDHRASPGIDDETARAWGLPPALGEGRLFEAKAITCAHCERTVILNPERERPRAICFGCDLYICDDCAAAAHQHGCRSFTQVLDEANDAIAHGQTVILAPGPGATPTLLKGL